MTIRLTNLERDDWELDDGEQINRQHPDTFWIPDHEERSHLQPERIVKLIFRIRTLDDAGVEEINVERMWVTVKGCIDGLYRGVLENDPCCTDDMQAGREVWFQPRHVIDIYKA